MNLKSRLATLEAKTPVKSEPIRICNFIIYTIEDNPTGYESNCGAVINRLPNESVDELKGRCGKLANWDDGRRRIFEPIYSD